MDIFELPGVLLRRWLYVVATAAVCVVLAGVYAVVVKTPTQAIAQILIDPQGLSAVQTELAPQVTGPAQDAAMLESQIYLIQSAEILGEVVDKLDLTHDAFLVRKAPADKDVARSSAIGAMQKNLFVTQQGQSFVVAVAFKHPDPARAAEIANAVASVYLKKIHEAKTDAAERASDAFQMQAQALAQRLRKAENELEAFKAANRIVSTGQQGLVIDQQVEGVNRQLLAARADLGSKRASFDQARSLTVGSVQDGAIPEAIASVPLGTMRARYADLVAQMNERSSSLGASHPQMQAIQSQVAGMRQAIEQELDRIRVSLKSAVDRGEANVAALERRLNDLTGASFDAGAAAIQARELQSQVDTLRALYKTFLSRSQELGQRDLADTNNSRIISKAVAAASSSSLAKLMIVVAGGLFGVISGCGLAILRELGGKLFLPPPQVEPAKNDGAVASRVALLDSTSAATVSRDEPAEPVAGSRSDPFIIAHLVERSPVLGRLANATFRTRAPVGDIGGRGLVSIVAQLRERISSGTTDVVILLSPGRARPAAGLVRQLAEGLHAEGLDILYADGDDMSDDVSDEAAPLAHILHFHRLSHTPSLADQAPTFRNFVNRLRKPHAILVDGRGAVARRHQAALIDQADGILVLADQGVDMISLRRFIDELPDGDDRLIGAVMIDQAA
ncbi:succinoglycan biosynthesis transport protein ExoP [Rhizobium sp. SG_E_25_P2]|uniref:GumC family protein n=1 Tax=Rhizobium sp. SG_E_25_P2 TaxID=2879942 RepID=UPI002474FF96|nr:GumC family protein [Rhizobium sp. SG_E_25_P2]MDH6266370.1 succinoglycan biosynthesis transport protein ExoP [Rhizobium sp. SG_E_25_P2]